jgi:hypothetical protein
MSAAVIPLRPGDGTRRPWLQRGIARGLRIVRGIVEAVGWLALLGSVINWAQP